MKKTLTIIVLLAIIATAIVWNVRAVISKKNNEAAVTRAATYDKTTQTEQISGVSDKGGTPLQYSNTSVSGCMDKTSCSYDKDAKDQKNAKCFYAWYTSSTGVPAFPASTDTKKLIDHIVANGTVEMFIKVRDVQYDENAAVLSINESNPKSVGKASATNSPKLMGTNACDTYNTAKERTVFPAVNPIPVPQQVQRIKILNN